MSLASQTVYERTGRAGGSAGSSRLGVCRRRAWRRTRRPTCRWSLSELPPAIRRRRWIHRGGAMVKRPIAGGSDEDFTRRGPELQRLTAGVRPPAASTARLARRSAPPAVAPAASGVSAAAEPLPHLRHVPGPPRAEAHFTSPVICSISTGRRPAGRRWPATVARNPPVHRGALSRVVVR